MSTRIFFLLLIFPIAFSCKNNDTAPAAPEQEAAAPADARFELLPAAQTGVHFSNTIKEDFTNHILINSYLYNGGGVAVLDVNNDGLQDLYFSATQEPNRLFLNKGNFQFEDITEKAGVAALGGVKTGVTVVDINADGLQDIYVCRSGMQPTPDRANLLYINNGDLTFSEKANEYGLADRSASNHANFFDYDLDGDLDVYLLNHPVAFQEVNRVTAKEVDGQYIRNKDPLDEWESDKMYRNDGNGHFTNVSREAGISNRAWGLSVTVSDFNNDGYPDIFVGNDYIEPDLLYINNRNGTFSVQTDQYFRHMSNHTMGVDVADFNNDGLVDVVALDMVAETNQRQKELMTTMILDRYNNLVRFHYGHQIMRNVLQVNTGANPSEEGAVFSDIGVLSGIWNTDWSWSPLLADFDNDGLKDLYITNGYRRDISNLDYLNYTAPQELAKGLNQERFKTIEDYLKLIPTTPLRNYMFKNKDGLDFENISTQWGFVQPSYSNGSAYADLDNDGDLELVVNNIIGDVFIYKNKSVEKGGGNWLQVKLKGSGKNPFGTGTKVRITYDGGKTQYQEMTPTRGFFSSSQPILHFGLGNTASIEKLEVRWMPDGKVQNLGNVKANQVLTLNYNDAQPGKWETPTPASPLFKTASNLGINFRHKEDEFIDFNRERLLPHKFSNLGPSIAVGDVNGDGLEDFFVGGARDQAGALFVQQPNSTFKQTPGQGWEQDASYEDMGAAFFDADGDKDLDLYVASGGSTYDANSANYQDRLYLNDGKGRFARAADALPQITASGSCVRPYDFDKDGDLDVFVGGLVSPGLYPTAPMTCLLKNDGGKFTEVCDQVSPALHLLGMVNDFIWADLDGDKQEELIVAGEWLPVTIFKNSNGKLENKTSAFGLENTTGWWNCLAAADLDNDGDMDLVAGNLGLNSRLKATATEPLELFAKDFDNNGSLDPVLAYYNGGKLYPLPLRDNLIKQIPSLKKKFVYYTDYGKATLDQVFSSSELETSQHYQAKTFTSSWFENKDGKFLQHPLPTEAQFAPINKIQVGDYNGDGHQDLLMVGNSSSPDVETGRYDAGNGVLILGDGKGNFKTMPNRDSGFWATKEARDLEKVKLANGKTLFLIANNNDVIETYLY
ncbi:MAG: VCBS repeat-containing protein [Lewinellaceae bacterium]|nr:VCBS repeat-containing protein [Saprospiraceae bacterium]MCB9340791.1 VCBS repeat-containing protein [Lewinellaceae bacterium]